MSERKFAKQPMLFIDQPGVNTPKAPMQHRYVTPKQAMDKKTVKADVTENVEKKEESSIKKKRPQKKNTFYQELRHSDNLTKEVEKEEAVEADDVVTYGNPETIEDDKIDEEVIQEEKAEKKKKGRKQFKDMTIVERIEYFLDTPAFAPKLKCEVKTASRSFRGIIVEFKDDIVYMQVGRRSSATKIALNDIKQVRLLGF